jgi:hypothetical protein
MARLFHKKGARIGFGATSLGAAAAMMSLLITSGSAYAATVLPGQSGSYNASASSSGLYLSIAGHQLTGGTSSASGTYAGASNEQASASGQGFLLSSQITGNGTSASVDNTKGAPFTASQAEGKNSDGLVNGGNGGAVDVGGPTVPAADCNQGGGGGQMGVGLFVGIGCGYSSATVDDPASSAPTGPQALGVGQIADVHVDLAGILGALGSGGLNQLCTALQGASTGSAVPVPGLGTIPAGATVGALSGIPGLGSVLSTLSTATGSTQAASSPSNPLTGPGGLLTDIVCNLLQNVNPSVQLTVGSAYSEVVSTTSQVFAKAHSSSVDLSLLAGVISGTNPLLRVQIPSATAETCEGSGCSVPSGACQTSASGADWTSWYNSGLIEVSGLLVDTLHTVSMGSIPDPIEIPPCGALSPLVNAINGSPLGQVINLQLATASATGNGVSGSGLQVKLLPGMVMGNDLLTLDGAGIQTAANNASAAGPATNPQSNPPVLQSAQSPTSVHTGEWFAGSLPLLAVLAALGGGLLGWPRLRRFPMVARLVSRGSR